MTKLVWRNLMRNKRRSFLTVASVALALFLLTMLGTVLQALTDVRGSTQANRLVARNAISLTFSLPEAYGQRLAALDHVVAVTILDWFQGTYKDQRPENFFPRFGTDPDTLLDVFPEVEIDPEQLEEWRAERTAFLAGRSLAEAQGWKLGDVITIKGDIYPVDLELTLRGIFDVPGNSSAERIVYFHRRYVEEALGNPGQVGTFWLLLDDPKNVAQVIEQGEAMFENSTAQVRVETEEAFALSFLEMLGNVRFLFGSIGLAVVISIFLITANTMAMAARERTREVAVLRTLGFRRQQVLTMVIAEALVVGLVGAVLGVALGSFALRALDPFLQNFGITFQNLVFDPTRLLQGLGVGLLIGVLSGLPPALSAARLRIVDGLRTVA